MKQTLMGCYIPLDSPLHRLDARAKILSLFLLLAAVICAKNALQYAFIIAVTLLLVALSRLRASAAFASLWRIRLFLVVIFLMNALFYAGKDAAVSFWIFRIGKGGLIQGANVVMHVMLLVVLSNLLTCTSAPLEITDALERLLRPLGFFHLPVELIAMILSTAIGFIPTLAQEADMIQKAQTARGARFESRRLHERALSYLPLVIPIFLCAFRRADELSVAMEARGYRDAKSRTKRDKKPFLFRDATAVICCAAVCAVQVLLASSAA